MQENSKQPEIKEQPKRPDEKSGVVVDGFVKIFDPNTKETFVETRT